MATNLNNDDLTPIDLNSPFDSHSKNDKLTAANSEDVAAATYWIRREAQLEAAPSWEQILAQHSAAIEADYTDGLRDKMTICGWNTIKAAKRVAKKRGAEVHRQLWSAGFDEASRAWDKYDATKDKGNGIESFVFKSAEGAMRNAANEMANPFDLRKHSKDEALPTAASYDAKKHDHGLVATGVTPAIHTDDIAEADLSRGSPAAIAAAADGAANSTSNEDGLPVAFTTEANYPKAWKPWPLRTVPAAEASNAWTDRQARIATDVFADTFIVHVLSLPKKDSNAILHTFGLEGKEELTDAQIAKHIGVSESYVGRLQKKVIEQLREIARKGNPKMMSTIPEKPVFRNGAKVTKRRSVADGKYRAQALDLWSASP
jgi:hypothetical protein